MSYMNRMRMKGYFDHIRYFSAAVLIVAGLFSASSCKRVPLHDPESSIYLELSPRLDVGIAVPDTIDLQANPQYNSKLHIATPSRMVACFYDSKTHKLADKEYVDAEGGYISSLPAGTYDMLVYQLGTSSTQTEKDGVRDEMRAFTSDITASAGRWRRTSADPRTKANNDIVIVEPDHILVARLASVTIPENAGSDGPYVIKADAATSLDTYSFIARNIQGIENARTVQAMVTGQAGSKYLWAGNYPLTPANLLTSAVVDLPHKCFYGVYNTFGNFSGKVCINLIIIATDGQEHIFSSDVTDQVNDPGNTDHVIYIDDLIEITVSGDSGESGYNPTVDEWDDEIIDIPIS